MKGVFAVLIIIGLICMALSIVSGIGYGLYLLGVVGLEFGPAAWAGFVLWAKMFFGGLISVVVGAAGGGLG